MMSTAAPSQACDQLHRAVIERDLDIVRQLVVEKEVDVRAKDEEGQTALHFCALYNDVDAATTIVQHDRDPAGLIHVGNKRNNTPLHLAALSSPDTLAFLLQRLQDLGSAHTVDPQNQWKETPLMLAAQSGCVNAAIVLVRHNASLKLVDQWERTALDIAQDHGETRVFTLLTDAAAGTIPSSLSGPSPSDVTDQTEVEAAAGGGTSTVDPYEAKKKAAAGFLSKMIEFPLDREMFFRALKDPDVDPVRPDMFGLTALHKLCAWNLDGPLRWLLQDKRVVEAGIHPVAASAKQTPLEMATDAGATRCVDVYKELET
eukprot:GFYU01017604.1.p1 GENE.GFYU01017604.1~~GFYU01017604.1.p1  ORF type:complete len:316 (-),score=71.74 GFYU01017604.1:160-1107(-)